MQFFINIEAQESVFQVKIASIIIQNYNIFIF